MYEYSHGGNACFEPNGGKILDLSASINPLGPPKGVEEAIRDELSFIDRYPDSYNTELREKIAAYEKVNKEWIFCGSGASDIIFRIPALLRVKNALVTGPTFSDYERSLSSFGAKAVHHMLKKENGFKVDIQLLRTLSQHETDLVFICNPNNPTGVLTDRTVMEELLAYCKAWRITVVVDECFMDFVLQAEDYTAKYFLSEYQNLIILKAFTKVFAMPGIRLGYALCSNQKTIRRLHAHGADWAVSNLAQGAGIAAMEHPEEYISRTVTYVEAERKRLQTGLTDLGFEVFDSRANYVFFHSPYGFDLYEELNRRDIRIRSCHNYTGLSDRYYRIGVSTHENNRRLLTALKEIRAWQNS